MPVRIAAVAFFNTKPLIEGLDADPAVKLSLHVPSALLGELQSDRADVALLPTIDYQKLPGLTVLPVGGIGCDGPTLTVRLFSRTPIESTRRLACDADSHTSVALAQIILAKQYGLKPEAIPLDEAVDAEHETRLLIGDKVVCDGSRDLPHQLDLGQAWKELTGLPFVFAVWTCRSHLAVQPLQRKLSDARVRGQAMVDQLVERYAIPRGWPADLARRYLTEYLQFEIGARQLEAIRQFHRLAYEVGALQSPPEPLRVAGLG